MMIGAPVSFTPDDGIVRWGKVTSRPYEVTPEMAASASPGLVGKTVQDVNAPAESNPRWIVNVDCLEPAK